MVISLWCNINNESSGITNPIPVSSQPRALPAPPQLRLVEIIPRQELCRQLLRTLPHLHLQQKCWINQIAQQRYLAHLWSGSQQVHWFDCRIILFHIFNACSPLTWPFDLKRYRVRFERWLRPSYCWSLYHRPYWLEIETQFYHTSQSQGSSLLRFLLVFCCRVRYGVFSRCAVQVKSQLLNPIIHQLF